MMAIRQNSVTASSRLSDKSSMICRACFRYLDAKSARDLGVDRRFAWKGAVERRDSDAGAFSNGVD